jgi:polyisoprenoid-binding protein YceI
MHFKTLLALSVLLGGGCAEDPSTKVAPAKVSPAQTPATPSSQGASDKAEVKANQPVPKLTGIALQGEIAFVGSKVTGSHTGRFTNWIGTAQLDASDQLTSISIVVQTKDLEADYEAPTKWTPKLEAHLKDDDFFASSRFPTATFQLDKVSAIEGSSGGATHQLGGTFTIRGVSKGITFPATVSSTKPFAARAEFSIKRKDFGIMYEGKKDNLIRDGVVLKIDLKAK